MQKIAEFGVSFTLNHILVSRDNFALSIRYVAKRDGRMLNEHLATVCHLKNDKIAAIETYLSDVDGMNAFFV